MNYLNNLIFATTVLFMSISMNAQDNKLLLVNKTFEANVGSVCEETPDNNPCSGWQVYLVLEFKEKDVMVTEKSISSCGEASKMKLGNYTWALLNNTEVQIDAKAKEVNYTYLENLQLELRNGQLLGKRVDANKRMNNYVFTEVLDQE